jgi:starch phosphorylase
VAGKELIRQVVGLARQEPFRRRIVFLEDYDMAATRFLVGGADVWLNTPRRGREASGTSGMKAAANGVLNLSVLDGWWDEAWRDSVPKADLIGWSIGRGEAYEDTEHQDRVEAEALYHLLEQDVVPTFYDRGDDGLPHGWIARMRASIEALCHFFNTHRMVCDYTERFYVPAGARFRQLSADGMDRTRALADWRGRIVQHWSQVRIRAVEAEHHLELEVGADVRVRARVYLGVLTPDDVRVELYLGRLNPHGEIVDAEATLMEPLGGGGERGHLFEAAAGPSWKGGLHGYTVRVLPHHPDLATPFLPGLIAWAGSNV